MRLKEVTGRSERECAQRGAEQSLRCPSPIAAVLSIATKRIMLTLGRDCPRGGLAILADARTVEADTLRCAPSPDGAKPRDGHCSGLRRRSWKSAGKLREGPARRFEFADEVSRQQLRARSGRSNQTQGRRAFPAGNSRAAGLNLDTVPSQGDSKAISPYRTASVHGR